MADFLIQTQGDCLEDEERFIERELKRNRYIHSYNKMTLEEVDKVIEQGKIPVGTIQFVEKYLQNNYGVANENPIEIPKYLRTDEFLKRNYKIVTWENIPRSGKFFLKDVSTLKNFGDMINATYTDIDELFNYVPKTDFDSTLVLDKTHLFQVSQPFNIKSEYRVYVIGGEIEAICNYNGDPTLLPDMNLIKKAVLLINNNEKWLRSYTIDVMVGSTGTAIIEIHNFASVGLYTTQWGSSLLYAYRDGIDYLINDNKVIEI